jgi:hypothetical protein
MVPPLHKSKLVLDEMRPRTRFLEGGLQVCLRPRQTGLGQLCHATDGGS